MDSSLTPHAGATIQGTRRGGGARRVTGAAAMVILGLLLGLLLLEATAAVFLPAPLPEHWPPSAVVPDPDLGWRMVPHDVHYTYTHLVALDEHGLRTPAFGPKQPGETRILVLGDSEVYGQGVDDAALFTAQLERRLNAGSGARPAQKFTIINAGVRAYATDQELAFLEKTGFGFRPDLVVLCVYVNDFEVTQIAEVYRRGSEINGGAPYLFDVKRPAGPEARLLWSGIQLLRRSRTLMTAHDVIAARSASDGYEMRLVAGTVDDDIRRRSAQFEEQLRRFRRLLDAHRTAGVVVIIPVPEQIRRPELPPRYQDLVAAAAERAGLPAIDLLPAFRTRFPGRAPILPYDPHYDASGHALIAEVLAQAITAPGATTYAVGAHASTQ
ncbi:GDSL-type esterase/lipase family protein [Candidatus Binatia bacterium]|nr:GDSL-type esterase/lipase family protein [Candidatus Binatia bacterium]